MREVTLGLGPVTKRVLHVGAPTMINGHVLLAERVEVDDDYACVWVMVDDEQQQVGVGETLVVDGERWRLMEIEKKNSIADKKLMQSLAFSPYLLNFEVLD